MDEASNALGDFGLSLIKLCKFEDDEGSALGQYTQQGAATRSLASTCKIAGQVSPQNMPTFWTPFLMSPHHM